MEQRTYINPIGQKVVDVDCGYKVYDSERKDAVILRVGDDYKGKYVYIDRKPVEECTAEICFMSPMTLAPYETALKMIGCTDEFTDEQKLEKIISMNIECGIRGNDIVIAAKNSGKDPMEIFNEFIEESTK